MTSSPIPLFYHDDYIKITQTPGHPESPDRVLAIMSMISERKIPVDVIEPASVDRKDLLKVHDGRHVDRVRDLGVGFMDPDTFHHDHTYNLSLRAAGGVVSAMEMAVKDRRSTFTIPRPPGHHAGSDYNMGFCYFNNVALAARTAIEMFDDIEKVAIVDIDAHHGNGTNDIFSADEDVLYISTHQWGIFPGTGHRSDVGNGKGEGKTVNLPLPGGSGDPSFESVTDDIIVPVIESYSPDLLFISLGVDSHIMDPLTSLTLSTPGYLRMIEALKDIATRTCNGRVVHELEGGYHLRALAEVFVGAMNMHLDDPLDFRTDYNETKETMPDPDRIGQFMDVQSSYWNI